MEIDTRSDTVTRPDAAMRRAMMEADVGDDVYGEDPTVNRLEARAAEILGHEAALFLPTGTQSNLVALLSHCGRGDEYIVGAVAHTYRYEGGGAAALGGIQPQTVPFDSDGGLSPEAVRAVIKPVDFHFARTRLVCLENTQHGRVQSLARMQSMRDLVDAHSLALHLDGARLANAVVHLGCTFEDVGRLFDSVSLCLSKGLGAPVGSVLVGSRDFIAEARHWRKVTGGGMRQAGVLAAAAMIALEQGPGWIARDHAHAQSLTALLESALGGIDGIEVRRDWTCTNMVWLDIDSPKATRLAAHAREQGVLLSVGDGYCRLVMHRDIKAEDLPRIVAAITSAF